MLEVVAVSKSFGGIVANRSVSLSVPAGAVVGLIGPNGSGKTTLFNSIVGHHAVDAGMVRFAGRDITRLRVAEIARLGLLRTFQQTRVYRRMSTLRNVEVCSSPPSGLAGMFGRFGRAVTSEAESLLALVDLHAKRHLAAGELSFGQQKLLELAMALMQRPKMLLLDEPTAGINPTLINDLIALLRRLNGEFGITLLVIEHNMQVIMELAQHIVCLAHGAVLAEGSPQAVRNDPRVLAAYLGEAA